MCLRKLLRTVIFRSVEKYIFANKIKKNKGVRVRDPNYDRLANGFNFQKAVFDPLVFGEILKSFMFVSEVHSLCFQCQIKHSKCDMKKIYQNSPKMKT